jgi:hypothetical protein
MIFILLFRRNKRRKAEADKLTTDSIEKEAAVQNIPEDTPISISEPVVTTQKTDTVQKEEIKIAPLEKTLVKTTEVQIIEDKNQEPPALVNEEPKVVAQSVKKAETEPKKEFDVQEYRRELAQSDANKKRKELEERIAEIRRKKPISDNPKPVMPTLQITEFEPVIAVNEREIQITAPEIESFATKQPEEIFEESVVEEINKEFDLVTAEKSEEPEKENANLQTDTEPNRNTLPEKKYTFTEWIQKLGNPG